MRTTLDIEDDVLQAARELAHQIAVFPQHCMLADRESTYRQWNLPLDEALRQEGERGYRIVFEEGVAGAARFSGGAGRHGGADS